MTDTTTISIREDQRDELEAQKEHPRESMKAVVDRLLDADVEAADTGESLEVVSTEALTDGLMDDFDSGSRDGASYDDIKAACAAAIRDELGEVLDR